MNSEDERTLQNPPSQIPSMSLSKRLLYLTGMVIILPLAVVVITRAAIRPDAVAPAEMATAADGIGRIVLGIFIWVFTVGVYLLAVFTCRLTFDFRRPVFGATYKLKAFLSHIVVFAGIAMSLSFIGTGVVRLLFVVLGVGLNPILFGLLPALLVANLLLVKTNIWAHAEVLLARQRLEAHGRTAADFARGTWVGISDVDGPPQRGLLEEDLGMLWLEPEQLVYRGDHQGFVVPRSALIEIERAVFGKSASAYAGNRHIVLRFTDAQGRVKRIRLHLEGCWTMSSLVKATDVLAERLVAWQSGAA